MLVLSRKPGQRTYIGDNVVTFLRFEQSDAAVITINGRERHMPLYDEAEIARGQSVAYLGRSSSKQARFGFSAPKSVDITRDDAKRRERV